MLAQCNGLSLCAVCLYALEVEAAAHYIHTWRRCRISASASRSAGACWSKASSSSLTRATLNTSSSKVLACRISQVRNISWLLKSWAILTHARLGPAGACIRGREGATRVPPPPCIPQNPLSWVFPIHPVSLASWCGHHQPTPTP